MARKSVGTITIWDNADPPRIAEGTVYRTAAVFNTPSKPTATGYNFTTGALSGLTSGWSQTPVAREFATSNAGWYTAKFTVTQAPGAASPTITFTTPVQDVILGNVISRGVQVFTPRTIADITTSSAASIVLSSGQSTAGISNGAQVVVENASVEAYNKTYTVTGVSGQTITTSTSTSGFSNFTGTASLRGQGIEPNINGTTLTGRGALLKNDGDFFVGNAAANYIFFDQSTGLFTVNANLNANNITTGELNANRILVDGDQIMVNDDGELTVGTIPPQKVAGPAVNLGNLNLNASSTAAGLPITQTLQSRQVTIGTVTSQGGPPRYRATGYSGGDLNITNVGDIAVTGLINLNGADASSTLDTRNYNRPGAGGDVVLTSEYGNIYLTGGYSLIGGDARGSSFGGNAGSITLSAPNGCIMISGSRTASAGTRISGTRTPGSAGSVTSSNSTGNVCAM